MSLLVFLIAEWVIQVRFRALSGGFYPAKILGQNFGSTQFDSSQTLIACALHALVFR